MTKNDYLFLLAFQKIGAVIDDKELFDALAAVYKTHTDGATKLLDAFFLGMIAGKRAEREKKHRTFSEKIG